MEYNAEYWKQVKARFYARHPKKAAEYSRRNKFGLEPEQFNEMVQAQNNLCAICGKEEPDKRNGVQKSLAVDHNRKTGAIRKLLCSWCNRGIGHFREDTELMQRAIGYLKEHE